MGYDRSPDEEYRDVVGSSLWEAITVDSTISRDEIKAFVLAKIDKTMEQMFDYTLARMCSQNARFSSQKTAQISHLIGNRESFVIRVNETEYQSIIDWGGAEVARSVLPRIFGSKRQIIANLLR